MKKYRTTLTNIKHVAKDTIEVSLRRPDNFHFRAGQYIQLGIPQLLYSDSAGNSRLMSIASSPLDPKEICVAFRDTGSGYKSTLKSLQIGSAVIIEGPYGFFTLSEQLSRPVVLIAGGIGITPYRSMVRYAATAGIDTPITLLYANSNNESSTYLKELLKLSRNKSTLKVKNTLHRIDERFIMDNVSDPYDAIWYISGPLAMVNSVRHLLFSIGIVDDRICFEEFTGY